MNDHSHDGELCKSRGGTPNSIECASYTREGIKGAGYGIELETLGVEGLDGENVVDLSGGGGSGRTVRRELGGDKYLGEEWYDGDERGGGENGEGEGPGTGDGEEETCKGAG